MTASSPLLKNLSPGSLLESSLGRTLDGSSACLPALAEALSGLSRPFILYIENYLRTIRELT